MKLGLAAAAAAVALAAASGASATILASVPANGSPGGDWSNFADFQNFLVQFTLAGAATVDGFDIYTDPAFGALGTDVTIRIRNDVAGNPDSSNLFEFTSTIDTLTTSGDQVFVGAHFGGLNLAAGTYWMGMSGTSSELGWESYHYGDDAPSTQRQLSGETVVFTPGVGTFGYAVEGANGVPEPAAWAMMLLGFFGLGGVVRARRGATAA
jgi:hypothetical protein